MVMTLRSSTITTEIDGGTIRGPELIIADRVGDLAQPGPEAPVVEANRVVDTQLGVDPEGEAVQVEGADQAVAADPVAVVAPGGEDSGRRDSKTTIVGPTHCHNKGSELTASE